MELDPLVGFPRFRLGTISLSLSLSLKGLTNLTRIDLGNIPEEKESRATNKDNARLGLCQSGLRWGMSETSWLPWNRTEVRHERVEIEEK